MGDVVLKEVGKRLMNLGQDRCTAIRIGGDEFLVIFRNASSASAIENVGKLICSKMDEPIEAHVVTEDRGEQHETFTISASIGVARYPADTTDMESLLKCADEALYKIKHTHEKSAYLLYKAAEA
jgi:diguanylate cyclase (GGDEF)-like protein